MLRHPIVPSDSDGYSLIEVLTVLVLVLLMVSLAVPSMGSYVGQQKTRRALDMVAADLAYARALAVRAGEPTTIEFQTSGDYLIQVENVPAEVVKRVSLRSEYPGISLSPPTGTGRLTFNRRGLLRDIGSGFLVASLPGANDTISITATGRVYRDF